MGGQRAGAVPEGPRRPGGRPFCTMINYDGWPVWKVIFSWNGTTLAKTWVQVCGVTLITAIIQVVANFSDGVNKVVTGISTEGHELTLFPVAFLLVYRSGTAYNRYFEGRGHVGKMVWTVRELARMVASFVEGDDDEVNKARANVARLIKAFTVANRLSVRGTEEDGIDELELLLTGAEATKLRGGKNHAMTIILWIGQALIPFKTKQYHPRALDHMQEQVGQLMETWMGMQKLATTPFPFPYVQLIVFFMNLWIVTFTVPAPGIPHQLGFVVVLALGFALYGLNAIGQELEDPFGLDVNDLPLEFFEGACNSACKALLPPPLDPEVTQGSPVGALGTPSHVPGQLVSKEAVPSPLNETAGDFDVDATVKQPNFAPKAAEVMANAQTFENLTDEMQKVFHAFFDRYDLNTNGYIDAPKELTQLVTNLVFALQMNDRLEYMMKRVEAVDPAMLNWNLQEFAAWYLQTTREYKSGNKQV